MARRRRRLSVVACSPCHVRIRAWQHTSDRRGSRRGPGRAPRSEVASHDQLAREDVERADLVVVGAPTHMHGLPTSLSRKMAAKASEEDGVPLDPSATTDPGESAPGSRPGRWRARRGGVRHPCRQESCSPIGCAASPSACAGGFELAVEPESFVDDAEGPLADGELERARAWGQTVASQITSTPRRQLDEHKRRPSRRRATSRPSLRHARVPDAMRPGVITCPPDSSMRDVARMMVTNHIHAVVVRGVKDSGAGAS